MDMNRIDTRTGNSLNDRGKKKRTPSDFALLPSLNSIVLIIADHMPQKQVFSITTILKQ